MLLPTFLPSFEAFQMFYGEKIEKRLRHS
jgi:hypothetical protein